MRTNLNTGDVEAFSAVGSTLSFRSAAARLNISASALSRRIQKLEEQLDVRLLDRTTRQVKLTLAGKQFLARSEEILTNVDELLLSLQGDAGVRASVVKIASIPSIAHNLLPAAIRIFHERFPATRVSIKDMTTNEVVGSVSRGEVDFGITSFVQHDNGLDFAPLVRGDVMAVVPRDHPLARRDVLRWSDLADQVVVSTWKGAGVRMVMDVDLARVRSPVKPFFEVQQMYTALRFVEEGLGIAPVPAFFLGPREYQSLCVLPLIEPTISVDLGSVVSRNHPLRSTAREALTILEQVCRTDRELTRRVETTHIAVREGQVCRSVLESQVKETR